ncbi:MAG: anaerobic glycerol-3-phosphate dehydrogenase subunit C [Armatimonadota bacterium]|jgi:FAD/FMN-containing dehydrogenase/Fe-S oxidoreductase
MAVKTGDIQAEGVAADLGDVLGGDVLFDDFSRAIYSTAACIYRIRPLGVVAPRDGEDVAKLVAYAADKGIPLTARGGGSGLSGQTVGSGIIVDLARYMNRIVSLDPVSQTVRVQPGIFLTRLNKALAEYGLFFPPDPSSADFCALGGMIANNAGGARTVKYGATKDYVAELDVVLASGESARVRGPGVSADGPLGEITEAVRRLLTTHRDTIRANWPEVNKNSSGYNLPETLAGGDVDLRKLIVGSEGTLALVTEASLEVRPLPPAVGAGLLYFRSRVDAARGIAPILELAPSSVELLDETFVQIVRETNRELRPLLPEDCAAALLVEFTGESQEVMDGLQASERQIVRDMGLATGMESAFGHEQRERLWALRRAAGPLVNRVPGARQAVVVIEDVAVLPERLPALVDGLEQILARHDVGGTIIGHAGNGNVHVRPILDLREADDVRRMEDIAGETCELVASLKGTLAAEHGDGLSRTPYLGRMFGDAYELFVEIKRIFDPEGILNPGKIVGDGSGVADNLRLGRDYSLTVTETRFDDERLREVVEKCHGCGTCQHYCPVWRTLGTEEATGRAKANLVREILLGDLGPEALTDERLKRIMDLCVDCKLCMTECPTAVDIATVCEQAKAEYVAARGQDPRAESLARADNLGRLGRAFAPISNVALQLRPVRWAMEAFMGVDRRRVLPPFHRGMRTTAHELDTEAKQVVYYAGCYAMYNDPVAEGQATIEVLERNGFQVHVPPLRCCGAALVSIGSSDAVAKDAAWNVGALKEYVDGGCTVVASAATCGLMVKHGYLHLVPGDATEAVAAKTLDVHELLLDLHEKGELDVDLGPVPRRVAYHAPCHLRAQGIGEAPLRLLRLIPELVIPDIEDSCCGIAGTFGMKREHFDLSMRMGEPLFSEIAQARPDVVATPCGTCAIQIRQGNGLPVTHPMELLRDAYRAAR